MIDHKFRYVVQCRIKTDIVLLIFLSFAFFIRWLAPEPKSNERNPAKHSDPDTCNPDPSCADLPASRPFVMSEMSYCHLSLDVDIGQKGSLVVDPEREYAMLIRESERR